MPEGLRIFADPPTQDTLLALQQLDQNSAIFRQALKLIADGTRDENRREAYGQLGLLEYLLELQHNCRQGHDEALRAIANACANNGKAHDVLLMSCSSLAMQ